jgi:DNA repair exonuclease SbcCD nuclease subunit
LSKIAIIGDTHFGARNNNQKLVSFFDKFYLDIFFPYLVENNIKLIIQTGDLWDSRKSIMVQSIYDARKYFFDRLVAHDIKMISILGNHDIVYRNTVEVNSSSVLLEGYKDHVDIVDKPKLIIDKNVKMLLLPWICEDNEKEIQESIEDSNANYCMGHFELIGFDMFKGQPSHEGQEVKHLDRFKQVFSGHYHHKSVKDNIMYVGTPYEMTWMDFDDQKGFHILDTETEELEFIKNPYVIHQKIIYDEAEGNNEYKLLDGFKNCFIKLIVKNKKDQYKFEKFLDKLNAVGVHEIKIIDEEFFELTTDVTIEVGSENTLSLIDRFVEESTFSVDKQLIKGYMNKLFVNASMVEI